MKGDPDPLFRRDGEAGRQGEEREVFAICLYSWKDITSQIPITHMYMADPTAVSIGPAVYGTNDTQQYLHDVEEEHTKIKSIVIIPPMTWSLDLSWDY